MSDTPKPVSTHIQIEVDAGEPEGAAADFGFDVGVTAAEVVAEMKTMHSRSKVCEAWDLIDDPGLRVQVSTKMSDGTWVRTTDEWSAYSDLVEARKEQTS